jgi:ABC-2 type transport system permease protein
MFATIYNFELSYWVKNPLVYVFGAALFAIPFLTRWGMSAEANVGDNITMMNSYYKINNMANMFALILTFLLPAIVGNSIFRDYKSRYYTLLYSFPFTKGDYLTAKFLSAFTVVIIIVCLLAGGFLLGSLMPGVKEAAMLPFDVFNYLHLIFVFLIPNMLFFGALVFALVLYTRNIYISFIGVIFMVIIQRFAKGVLGANRCDMMAVICDPRGDASIKYIVRYWTLEERNFNALPISGPILYNRVFWLGISGLIFAFSYFKFEFNQFVNTSSKRSKASDDKEVISQKIPFISLPSFQLNFSWRDHMRSAWHLSNMDFRSIVFTWPFQAILFAGGVLVLFQQYQMGPQDGVISIPTTSNMLRFPVFFFSAIVNLLTFLYAGVLIHKDRLYRMSGMIDSTSQPDWVFLLSKLLALVKVHFVLLALILFGGLIAQVVGDYYRFEIAHYLFELYVL